MKPIAPLVVNPAPLYTGVSKTGRGTFGSRPKGFDAWQLLMGVRGTGQMILPHGNRLIRPGDLFLFAPGTPQHYGNPGPAHWEHLFFVFHAGPHWQRWMQWPEIAPGIGFLHPRTEMRAIRRDLLEVVRVGVGTHRFGMELAMDFLHQALIRCQAEHLSTEKTEIDPRIDSWLEAVGADLKKSHLPIREMARQVGMSPSRLARAFHRHLNLSPVQYFEKMRMERAAELLTGSTMRVREISEALGYEDPLYFSSRFRVALGISPRQYRNKSHSGLPSAAQNERAKADPAHHYELSRMQQAAEFLARTTMPLHEVSGSFGFPSQSEFSERFRAVMGMSPLQYRRQNRTLLAKT